MFWIITFGPVLFFLTEYENIIFIIYKAVVAEERSDILNIVFSYLVINDQNHIEKKIIDCFKEQ